jgi:signal transduction histidine kinase
MLLTMAADSKSCIVKHLNRFFLSLSILLLALRAQGAWLDVFSSDLKEARSELLRTEKALDALGQPMIGNTVPEFGIQQRMMEAPPPDSPFVHIDLGELRSFDTVALIPAVVDFQGVTQSPYAFPVRFRLDASDDAQFATFTPLLVRTEVDHAQSSVAPVVVHVPKTRARYLRITVTKLAQVEGRWTFALAEIMVLEGNRNIALGAKVQHAGGTGLPPRWLLANLTDGRTPLGPPIDRSSVPEFDALFASIQPEVPQPWMSVDLGKELSIDEVRLHPLHARQGADVPGFSFPSRFCVEIAKNDDFGDAFTISENADLDYSNPGNNVVTLPANGRVARYVRVVMLAAQRPTMKSFAISEIEVYAHGEKVSRGAKAMFSGDPTREQQRPEWLLTDDHTSYGKLMELPAWLQQWERRRKLEEDFATLARRVAELTATAQERAAWTLGGAVLLVIVGIGWLVWRSHLRSVRAQEQFRARLARDMHDEIGSNLAGIAVISETSAMQEDATAEDWREINRLAHETTDAIREVLWLVGARQESGIDLIEHLQRVAKRLLPNHDVTWKATTTDLPVAWPVESRRHVFLFFKEALTNILRHAKATHVELSAQIMASDFELFIRDNGRGFDPAAAYSGMGLNSLRERAKQLGGTFTLSSCAEGTTLTLRVPLAS